MDSDYVDPDGNVAQGWVSSRAGGNATSSDWTECATTHCNYSINIVGSTRVPFDSYEVCTLTVSIFADGISLYWAIMTMTTVGYGDIHPNTEYEIWFAVLAMLIGGFVFGLIIGRLGELAKRTNPAERHRQQKMAELNTILVTKTNPEITYSVRSFSMHHLREATGLDSEGILMSILPGGLRHDVAGAMHWLDTVEGGLVTPGFCGNVPFFVGLSDRVMIAICMKLKRQLFYPPDEPTGALQPMEELGPAHFIMKEGDIGRDMFVVIKGLVVVEKEGKELGTVRY